MYQRKTFLINLKSQSSYHWIEIWRELYNTSKIYSMGHQMKYNI